MPFQKICTGSSRSQNIQFRYSRNILFSLQSTEHVPTYGLKTCNLYSCSQTLTGSGFNLFKDLNTFSITFKYMFTFSYFLEPSWIT